MCIELFDRIRNVATFSCSVAVFLSVFSIGTKTAHADDDPYPWQVGLASVNITPGEPTRMAGYGSKQREQLSQGVASDLYAKAIAIEDQTGSRALLITTDVIGFTEHVSSQLYKRIIEKTGLERKQILINSSHTHAGPVIGTINLDWMNDENHIATTIAYTKTLCDQLVDLSVDATSSLQPANLSWGVGVAPFVMNRREFTERGVRLGVNPRGLVDRSVPVLKITSIDGKTRGVVIGAACHNTTLTGKDMLISGDYAGHAQHFLERQLEGATALFMQGCGGDTNPYPIGSEEIARVHGMTLGEEVMRVLDTKLIPLNGPLTTLVAPVELPLLQSIGDSDYDKLDRASGATRGVAEKLKKRIASGEGLPKNYSSQIALWQFGDDLTLVALPGEVVVDYVQLIEAAIGPRKLIVTAYNHDVFGYLPSQRVLREGGYEMRGVYAGGIGIFSPAAQDVVVENVKQLAKKANRL